jgi:hypothetical protein
MVPAMSNLKSTIDQLAQSFAAGILEAIRGASLQELLVEGGHGVAAKRGRGSVPTKTVTTHTTPTASASPRASKGRLARRSADDVAKVVDLVVDALKKSGAGMRSEELQKALKLSKKEIVRPITQALAARKIKKTGQKRATTYFAK